MFAGNIASIVTGGLVTIIVSIFENIRSSGSIVSGICGNGDPMSFCKLVIGRISMRIRRIQHMYRICITMLICYILGEQISRRHFSF